jgi:hypothetical protein
MNVREALYANRVTRGMLVADTSGMQEHNISATLPDPPPPQMNFSEEIMRRTSQLDPEGLLDKNVNDMVQYGPLAKDGEATDPCHTMSSSEDDNVAGEEDGGSYKSGDDDEESGGGEGSSGDEEETEMQVDETNKGTDPPAGLGGGGDGDGSAEHRTSGGGVGDHIGGGPNGGGGGQGVTCSTEAGGSGIGSGFSTGPGTAPHSHSQGTAGGGETGSGNNMNNFKMPVIPTAPKTDPKTKVPSGVKKTQKNQKKNPAPIPAEADAVPSKTYRAIVASKELKGKAGTIGGIASGQGSSYCGSFFNKGDNRVLRTVYKEDIPSQSVSSLSFNPVKWVCAACPKSHPIFGGGGGRRTVIVIADQNFPGLLPSAEGNCLAIIRLEKGCLPELVDFAINIAKSGWGGCHSLQSLPICQCWSRQSWMREGGKGRGFTMTA